MSACLPVGTSTNIYDAGTTAHIGHGRNRSARSCDEVNTLDQTDNTRVRDSRTTGTGEGAAHQPYNLPPWPVWLEEQQQDHQQVSPQPTNTWMPALLTVNQNSRWRPGAPRLCVGRNIVALSAVHNELRERRQDLRNHGDSPHEMRHDYISMAQDVAGFIEQHNLQNSTLIGHSM